MRRVEIGARGPRGPTPHTWRAAASVLQWRVSDIILRQDFAVSAERVFDALADQDNMGSWMGAKITVPVRSEGGLVGTVRRVHAGVITFDERIVEAERPRSIAYQISSPVPLLAKHRGEIEVESLGPRSARVTWTITLQLRPGFVGAPVRGVLSLLIRRALKRLAAQLAS